jgi:uncharacterized membrane protein
VLETSHILWNLFLAFVPVLLAALIACVYLWCPNLRKRWWVWAPLGLLWLGFLPNTAYLLTEWRHFIEYVVASPVDVRAAAHDRGALLSFLALATFYVVYSGSGLLAFSMAIWPVAQLAKPKWLTKAVFFYLCAAGVYLGLIDRLNTWDIFYHPKWVVSSALGAMAHPLLLLLTFGFAAVLWLNYWVFEVFVDGLLPRLRQMGILGVSGWPEQSDREPLP